MRDRDFKREIRAAQTREQYRKMRKQVNRRMTLLEKAAAADPLYSNILTYSYKKLQHELTAMGMGNRVAKLPDDFNLKQADKVINVMQDFLSAPTSTKTGTRKVYMQRLHTLNERYGLHMTLKESEWFWNSGIWDKLSNAFGSQTEMRVVAQVKKNAKQIKEQLQNERGRHDIESLKDVDGLDVNAMLDSSARDAIRELAEGFAKK